MPNAHSSDPFPTTCVMLRFLANREPDIAEHGRRVGRHARLIGEGLGLPAAELPRLELAAWLHDIGKLFIPAFLVHKRTAFDREEHRIMQRHTVLGARLLGGYAGHADLAEVARHHHHRWDGSGYPSRLKGSEIPLWARITAVADAYDAMTSDRSGGNRSHGEAAEEILRGRGTQFCPRTVDAFLDAESCARALLVS